MNPLVISGVCMGLSLLGVAVLARWVWRDHVRLLQQEEREREGTQP